MKSLTVCLPDLAYSHAVAEAQNCGVELSGFCGGILADHFLTHFATAASARSTAPVPKQIPSAPARPAQVPQTSFDVAEHFRGFPSESIAFAQAFVDEGLKLPGVQVFRASRGVGFKPNFVYIEYLMSRGGKAGIGVSFYGEPHRHQNPPAILKRGIPSYSRAKIYGDADLKAILPHIRQSYELKFGTLPEFTATNEVAHR